MMNFCTSEVDPVEQLRDAAGGLLVRRAMLREDWIAQSLFDIAAGDKQVWTPQEWHALIADLKTCRLRINDWLDLNA